MISSRLARFLQFKLVVLVACTLVASAGVATAASPVGYNAIGLVSISTTGGAADGTSQDACVSQDGAYVAFASNATNLTPFGGLPMSRRIYRRSLTSGETTQVDLAPGAVQPNGASYWPSISGDGKRVAYYSAATNLVSGDTEGMYDVLLWDEASHETTLVSVSTAGVKGDGQSYSPAISANGRFVAFESDATNLAGPDANGNSDIYLRDLASMTTTRVSVSTTGTDINGGAWEPSISADGRFVVFYSEASNVVDGDTNNDYDVFIRDMQEGVTERVSVDSDEIESTRGGDLGACSADGRFVVFRSLGSFEASDTNLGLSDVYLRDTQLGTTTLMSQSTSGVVGDDNTYEFAISGDGRYVFMQTYAGNFDPRDNTSPENIYVRDTLLNTTTLVSVTAAGVLPGGQAIKPATDYIGRILAFESSAANLSTIDTDSDDDIYVKDLMRAGSTLTLSSLPATMPAYGASYEMTGTLNSGVKPLVDRRVVVQVATAPGGPWADTSYAATSSPNGTLSVSVVPTVTAYFRMSFAGEGLDYDASASGSVRLVARASVGTPKAPSKMKRSKYYTVYGYLKPRHTSGTYPVRIYKYRKVSGKWKSYGYVKAKASDYSSYTKYSVKMKLTKSGKWRLRAYHPADAGQLSGWSKSYDYVTVP